MQTASDLYENAALVYIRLVSQVSREAARAIEQIHTSLGSHAALRAALIITVLKMEVQQNHWLPSIDLYTYLLEDYPDALPLAKYAMTCCLQNWAVPEVENGEWVELAPLQGRAQAHGENMTA